MFNMNTRIYILEFTYVHIKVMFIDYIYVYTCAHVHTHIYVLCNMLALSIHLPIIIAK